MTTAPPRALRRLAGVLLALAVVPALAFAAVQVFVQSESEAQLAQIRDEQLDGLLFSVNQNAWDVATTWADRLARQTAGEGISLGPDAYAFLDATPAVRFVVAADTAVTRFVSYGAPVPPALRSDGDTTGYGAYDSDALIFDAPTLFAPALVQRLLDQRAAGYRKLEPVPLDGGALALVFVADGATPGAAPRLLGMVVDPGPFVQDVVMPKLREVGRGGIELGVFREGQATPIAATASLARADVERQRPLWLLPEHTVGARVGEGSAEAVLRRRLVQSLLLLGGVTLVLGAGALVAWRGVRREVEVARMREDFVSNVSHELRTPLALIRMYGESLAQGRVPEDRKPRYYETIVAETERLSRLVGNVLHFNRFERGTAHVAAAPLDLGSLADEIAERYRPVVEREGCRLALDLPDEPTTVNGDRDALAEALVNLLDNAVKYGGEGGTVEVAVRRDDAHAVVEVADRGPGVPPAMAERVFDPFVRIQPESADGLVHTAKGTGLGLALVRRIATAHGGTATVRPRDGGGSVFRLALPTHA